MSAVAGYFRAGARARPGQQVAGHPLGHLRDADGSDRHLDRRRRHAAPVGLPRRHRRGDDLGDDRVRHRHGRGHAAHRVPRPVLRPEARLSLFARSVPRRLGPLRPGPLAADDGLLSRPPGAGRRRAATDRAGDPAPDLPARGAGDGDGAVRAGGGRRSGGRPGPGRLHHRQHELAVDFLHQHPGRSARHLHGDPLRARAGGHPPLQPRARRRAAQEPRLAGGPPDDRSGSPRCSTSSRRGAATTGSPRCPSRSAPSWPSSC